MLLARLDTGNGRRSRPFASGGASSVRRTSPLQHSADSPSTQHVHQTRPVYGHVPDSAISPPIQQDYDADENPRLALTHLIQTIGEAGRRVSREFCEGHPDIRWADIIGMRHKVVHDYLGVDEDIVWQVVTNDLPVLLASLEKLKLDT